MFTSKYCSSFANAAAWLLSSSVVSFAIIVIRLTCSGTLEGVGSRRSFVGGRRGEDEERVDERVEEGVFASEGEMGWLRSS